VSRSISAITDYARQPLFLRKPHGLVPTRPALRLATLRDELLQELASADRFGFDAGGGRFGRLAVGILPFSGQDFVARAFGFLTITQPGLRLMTVPGRYSMLARALVNGEIDCIIGTLRKPPPFEGIREVFLYEEYFTLVARHDHPCHTRCRTMSDLRNENWIVAPHGAPVRAYFERTFSDLGMKPPAQTCEILSFSDAEKVIMNSDSIGLLSYSRQHLMNLPSGLRKVDVPLEKAAVPIGLTLRERGDQDDTVRYFQELVINQLSPATGVERPAGAFANR